jgi:hypothetical protein
VSDPKPFGSVRLDMYVQGQWAISLLTEGWSVEEKQALLDGDKDAENALVDAAITRTLAKPLDVDPGSVVISMHDESKVTK